MAAAEADLFGLLGRMGTVNDGRGAMRAERPHVIREEAVGAADHDVRFLSLLLCYDSGIDARKSIFDEAVAAFLQSVTLPV